MRSDRGSRSFEETHMEMALFDSNRHLGLWDRQNPAFRGEPVLERRRSLVLPPTAGAEGEEFCPGWKNGPLWNAQTVPIRGRRGA